MINMEKYLVIISLILFTGCATAMRDPKTNSHNISSEAAVKCIQGILDRELTAGAKDGYNIEVEFEEPAIKCWGGLSKVGKHIYSQILAEAAMAEGSYAVLEKTCSWVLKENPASGTGQ